MKKTSCIVGLLACVISFEAQSEILKYTENTDSSTELALGYPIPITVDSLTAINGFRSYGSLHAQHQALSINNALLSSHIVGATHAGRDIYAYQFGDTDLLTLDGAEEAAFMINGGIHAREWQSPEVVTELMETLVEQQNDNHIVDYLLDNTNIIILPVLNIDGVMQTQRFPEQVTPSPNATSNSSPSIKFAEPRDGRMRRKNMPQVDEDLSTDGDRLQGVDLNRNSEFFFGVQAGNSVPTSLVYGGAGIFSEPETQALLEAAKLAPENQLRFYEDAHSFSRVLFVPQPNHARRNAITTDLATKFQRVTQGVGTDYFPIYDDVNQSIATTATYFAYKYNIPAWTLEIEPPQGFPNTPNGGAFYGGTGASHSGFIMPDSEIARTRDQLATAHLLAFYHQAGPAHVTAVEIRDANQAIVYSASWQSNGSIRTLDVNVSENFSAGQSYQLWVSFNKPMRLRNLADTVIQYSGMQAPLAPSLSLVGSNAFGSINVPLSSSVNNWLSQPGGASSGFVRYKDDAFMLPFTIPSSIQVSSASGTTEIALSINQQDLSELFIDSNPATIADWSNGAWSNYEDSSGLSGDQGGADASYRLKVSNATLTLSTPPSSSGSSGGSGSLILLCLLILLAWLKAKYFVTNSAY